MGRPQTVEINLKIKSKSGFLSVPYDLNINNFSKPELKLQSEEAS